MKSITRFASVFAVSAVLVVPFIASAATSVYTDSLGNFQYNSNNFSFGIGSGVGMGMFACGASNICQVASTILYIINYVLVPVLFAVAFIVFLYGIVLKYIFSHGDPDKVSEGHKLLLWGLIGFVVMISLWGLVNVIANTFGLYGISAPPPPRSY
ncbi:MAG: hypothetical protein Q7R59_00345 [bacterium]|nr:hypothetical protein [bacterium]